VKGISEKIMNSVNIIKAGYSSYSRLSARELNGAVYLAFILTLTFSSLFSNYTYGQNIDDLKLLVFEPVLIESIVEPEAGINDSSDESSAVTVREITSLPSSENPSSVSEFLFKAAMANTQTVIEGIESDIFDYEEKVKSLELQGGAYEPELSEELLSLGTLYQNQGLHALAIEQLDKALHINRVNLGLFNLEQEKIIEEKIESYVAMGDIIAADLQQEYLIYLKRKIYGNTSVELLPALNSYADWNIFAFDSRLATDFALNFSAEANINTENQVNNSLPQEDVKTVRLLNAQYVYRTIIDILLNNFGLSDRRLLDMEKKLALTNYFFATNLAIRNEINSGKVSTLTMDASQGYYNMPRASSNSMGYRRGREALERRIDYMKNMEGISPTEIALAQIELADWLLIFNKRTESLDIYQQVYNELKASGTDQDKIDTIFSPDLPVQIPVFIDYQYSRAAWNIPEDIALEYKGWVDVQFRINRFGQPQDVTALGRSEDTIETIEIRLLRQLRNSSSFRPRFWDDQLLEDDLIEARYYYSF